MRKPRPAPPLLRGQRKRPRVRHAETRLASFDRPPRLLAGMRRSRARIPGEYVRMMTEILRQPLT